MENAIIVSLVNNVVLFYFLGIDIIFNKSSDNKSPMSIFCLSILSICIASFVNYFTYKHILQAYSLEYILIFVFAINLLISTFILKFILKSVIGIFYIKIREALRIVSYSTLIYGVSLLNIKKISSLSDYLYVNMLMVIGFSVIYWIIFEIKKKIMFNSFPKYVHPVPILFVILGLLTMAFKGFANAFY